MTTGAPGVPGSASSSPAASRNASSPASAAASSSQGTSQPASAPASASARASQPASASPSHHSSASPSPTPASPTSKAPTPTPTTSADLDTDTDTDHLSTDIAEHTHVGHVGGHSIIRIGTRVWVAAPGEKGLRLVEDRAAGPGVGSEDEMAQRLDEGPFVVDSQVESRFG